GAGRRSRADAARVRARRGGGHRHPRRAAGGGASRRRQDAVRPAGPSARGEPHHAAAGAVEARRGARAHGGGLTVRVDGGVRRRLPCVVTVHSMWDPLTRALYRLLKLLYGWQRWGLVATTVSGAAAAPIRRVAGPQVPVRVVSNGLDLSGWRLFPDGGAPEARGEVHIVAVGRLAPRKRPVGLLRILEKARARVPAAIPLRATVIGDGPARPAMERYLARRGMGGWV